MFLDVDLRDKFIGSHKKGVPTEGKNGTMIWKDGTKYVGTFKGMLYNGYGVLTFAVTDRLDKYLLTFKDDFFSGVGVLTFKYGTRFIGNFSRGMFDGKRVLVFTPDPYDLWQRYEGEFLNSEYDGNGTLLFKNEDFYIGQFQNGLFNGYGKITYGKENNYINYTGTFKENQFLKSLFYWVI